MNLQIALDFSQKLKLAHRLNKCKELMFRVTWDKFPTHSVPHIYYWVLNKSLRQWGVKWGWALKRQLRVCYGKNSCFKLLWWNWKLWKEFAFGKSFTFLGNVRHKSFYSTSSRSEVNRSFRIFFVVEGSLTFSIICLLWGV